MGAAVHWAIVRETREFLEDITSRLFKDEQTNERVKNNFFSNFVQNSVLKMLQLQYTLLNDDFLSWFANGRSS